MDTLPLYAASFAAGICAALGLGGGTVLILFLTAVGGYSRQAAQGINLVFFIPCALTALAAYRKEHLFQPKKLLPALLFGTVGAILGALFGLTAEQALMRRAFGAFLVAMGMVTLSRCQQKSERTSYFGGNQDNPAK